MFKPNCRVALHRRSCNADGSFDYGEEEKFSAFFMEHLRTLADGTQEDLSELLLEKSALPVPGDMVKINGLRRHIARVRSCTGADGSVRCYRCSFMGK